MGTSLITVLIGHRGSGKSALLQKLPSYFKKAGKEALIFDLDREIETAEKSTVDQLFASRGEQAFRDLEALHLARIVGDHRKSRIPVFIAAGAGFQERIPDGVRCLWIRRPTDGQGRIFLDRPRLDPDKTPLDEFLDRYKIREPRYRAMANEELTIPEGFEADPGFFTGNLTFNAGTTLTLQPGVFATEERLQIFLERRLPWNIRFELRDDLLSTPQIKHALAVIPPNQVLLSLRKTPAQTGLLALLRNGAIWDWPAELPLPGTHQPSILSLHDRMGNASVAEAGRRLEEMSRSLVKPKETILKLAVMVRDFDDLWQGHQWAEKDPWNRSFLPRSFEGRWNWYRLLRKGRSPLNFIREGDGSALDQPYLLDWARMNENAKTFAAILGDPVLHSLTPAEQWSFFQERAMPVLRVSMSELEWNTGAFEIIQKIGLRAAAVTSPLKNSAAGAARIKTAEVTRFQSANTLAWSEKEQAWSAANTDLMGLYALLGKYTDEAFFGVWGAGGTLPLLKELLPKAHFYSSRTGEERQVPAPKFSPAALIWGVGRARFKGDVWPPAHWKPAVILDLNYTEDSPGLEYALRVGARYLSGLGMFRKQAEGQREFWKEALKHEP